MPLPNATLVGRRGDAGHRPEWYGEPIGPDAAPGDLVRVATIARRLGEALLPEPAATLRELLAALERLQIDCWIRPTGEVIATDERGAIWRLSQRHGAAARLVGELDRRRVIDRADYWREYRRLVAGVRP